ncbi:GPW/gp25 family protein [Pluralibacter sp.]|jgi:phage baseplate assembly protein W|uniref:GPW/gp25 family protein n=1 Tax=Pluralibacter sp. TaxID=1920032 RepID=UPI0025E72F23|nr:GPW/gp25 family protein [Pluralibacter sp.]MBV8042100.1 GPW/gp25 family protein [Pluralibacter sp.]
MSDQLTKVFGRGWAFPPEFPTAGVKMAEGADDVSQSLWILFSTLPGERIMREEFGCDLNQFMFLSINDALMSDIEAQIRDSVLRYEPRAHINSLAFDTSAMSGGHLGVQVSYRLRGSDLQQQLTGQLDMADGRGITP